MAASTSSETLRGALNAADHFSAFLSNGFVSSLVVIGILMGVRTLTVRLIRGKDEMLSDDQRRWITRTKNIIWAMMVLSIVLIWAPQLRTFAVSLAAIAVAVVVATKELILCISGSLVRMSSQPFQVGDWVRIGNTCGEVVDMDIFSIMLEEIDHDGKTFGYTGKSVSLPNSVLLTTPVENLQVMKRFLFKEFNVTVNHADMDPQALSDKLQSIAQSKFEPYQKEATARIRKVERKVGIKLDRPEPEIYMRTTDLAHYVFTVKMFVPTREAHKIATAVTREFLGHVNALRVQIAADEKAAQDAAQTPANDGAAADKPATKRTAQGKTKPEDTRA